jgi:ribosomal protein S18 acetylase RimI-like enzyme
MFPDINFRQVTRSDLPDLEWDGEYIYYRRLYKEIYVNACSGKAILWVVDLNGSGLIGQLFVQLESPRMELADGNQRAYFYAFRIKKPFRGNGIGSRLLETAENDLLKQNFEIVTLNVSKENPAALRFYKNHGYKVIAHEPGRWFFFDHLGKRREVIDPSWRLEKNIKMLTSN